MTGYLHPVLSPRSLSSVVNRLAKKIRDSGLKYDFIACRGTSGLLVAGPLALALKKKIVVIRKEKKATHGRLTEYLGDVLSKCIVVDDLIDTGVTMRIVCRRIKDEGGKCVGIFLYNGRGWSSRLYKKWGKDNIPVFYL